MSERAGSDKPIHFLKLVAVLVLEGSDVDCHCFDADSVRVEEVDEVGEVVDGFLKVVVERQSTSKVEKLNRTSWSSRGADELLISGMVEAEEESVGGHAFGSQYIESEEGWMVV